MANLLEFSESVFDLKSWVNDLKNDILLEFPNKVDLFPEVMLPYTVFSNSVISGAEYFEYLHSIWENKLKPNITNSIEFNKNAKDIDIRVINYILYCMFINIFSSIEFNIKILISRSNIQYLSNINSISKIIRKSYENSVINIDHKLNWDDLILIRNKLIHHNGISKITKKIKIIKSEWEFISGKQIRGAGYEQGIYLLEDLFSLYHYWLAEVLKIS